jgi:hypothetical protein
LFSTVSGIDAYLGGLAEERLRLDQLKRCGITVLLGAASAESPLALRTRQVRCLSLAVLLLGRVLMVLFLVALSAIAAIAQSLEGRLKVVHDTGTLRIAYRTDSRPFSFLDAQGQPTGYTVELCERIGKSIERELALSSLAITWVQVDVSTRFQASHRGLGRHGVRIEHDFPVAHEDSRFFQYNLR